VKTAEELCQWFVFTMMRRIMACLLQLLRLLSCIGAFRWPQGLLLVITAPKVCFSRLLKNTFAAAVASLSTTAAAAAAYVQQLQTLQAPKS